VIGFKFDTVNKKDKPKEPTCPICFFEVESKDFITIEECGHGACSECYQGYLDDKIRSGPECVGATCPEDGCGVCVPLSIWK
jgi:hypothetical protein